jgi:hypothetical protein
MKSNMGKIDRAIRIVLAVIFIGTYALGFVSGTIGTLLLVLACVFVLTSTISFCPLYTLFGMSTDKTQK